MKEVMHVKPSAKSLPTPAKRSTLFFKLKKKKMALVFPIQENGDNVSMGLISQTAPVATWDHVESGHQAGVTGLIVLGLSDTRCLDTEIHRPGQQFRNTFFSFFH